MANIAIDPRDKFLIVNTRTNRDVESHMTIGRAEHATEVLNDHEARNGRPGVYETVPAAMRRGSYGGFRVSFNPQLPITGRWRAECFGVGMCAGTALALQRMMDAKIAAARRPPSWYAED